MVYAFLLFIALTELLSSTSRADVTCPWNGRQYNVGDTWHPVLEPFNHNSKPCINCTCEQTGKIKCVTERCSRPQCDIPIKVRGQCCPVCQVGTNGGAGQHSADQDCRIDGDVYEDGDTFPSFSTGITPTREDQCVMCVCSRGYVLCHLKTCGILTTCTQLVNSSYDCCPHCEGDDIEYQSDSDCTTPTGRKRNKDTWHPLIENFGPDKCVLCKCQVGHVRCSRQKCPRKLPCHNPSQKQDECCMSCPKNERGGKKKECRYKKDKSGKRKRRCRRRDRVKKRKKTSHRKPLSTQQSLSTKKHPDADTDAWLSSGCLPKRNDRFVYRVEERHSIKLVFDMPPQTNLEVLAWTVKRGRLSAMSKSSIPAAAFRAKISNKNVLGATNRRNFKKFKRKLYKKLQKCNTTCRRKVITSCLNRLKLKTVKSEQKCQKL